MSRAGRASSWQLRRLRTVALVVGAGTLIAACGGSAHSAARKPPVVRLTPAALVSQTFSSTGAVKSGRVALHLSLALDGITQLGGKPVTLDLAGPFSSTAAGTATDLRATLSAASSSAGLGLVLAGGKAYLGIDGTFYELSHSSSATAALGASGASGASGVLGMLSSLGIRPRGWLSTPHTIGQATVGGVATTHIRAQVNIPNLLGDLSRVTASGSTGATGASGSSSTSSTVLALVESAVTNATVDVYTGDGDHVVRRVDLAMAFTIPSIAAGALGGLTGGSLTLDLTLTDLGTAETITAPANAQPFSKLLNGVFALESRFGALAPLFASLSPGA